MMRWTGSWGVHQCSGIWSHQRSGIVSVHGLGMSAMYASLRCDAGSRPALSGRSPVKVGTELYMLEFDRNAVLEERNLLGKRP